MGVIEAADLHKCYGEVPAVAGIDLQVTAGEVVAVLGPNGAGKTTTIEMLLGLRSPSQGRVSVFGLPPQHVEVRGRVGAMLQDTDAPESLTVTEMVDLVGHYYPHALPVGDVVARADLSGHATKRVTQLSGGQRQRLSFALSIVGDPDLLFLDEPTAALDVRARQTFWQQVGEFSGLGKTVLFSTHNLAEADLAAERVVVIAHGRIIHDDSPSRIKALIPGKTIELLTDAPAHEVEAVVGVKRVVTLQDRQPPGMRERSHEVLQHLCLHVVEPEPVLRTIFAAGHRVEDLTVTEASLEQAFLRLTGEPDDPPTAPTREESLT